MLPVDLHVSKSQTYTKYHPRWPSTCPERPYLILPEVGHRVGYCKVSQILTQWIEKCIRQQTSLKFEDDNESTKLYWQGRIEQT